MAWYIDSIINDGYPTNTDFPEFVISEFTNNVDDVWYPAVGWRIDPNYNDGYPWIWWHLAMTEGWYFDGVTIGAYSSRSSDGLINIGGRQTNFPNGLSNGTTSNLRFDAGDMVNEFNWDPNNGRYIAEAAKLVVCDMDNYLAFKNRLSEIMIEAGTLISPGELDVHLATWLRLQMISKYLGANVSDSIISVKFFPFAVKAKTNGTDGELSLVDDVRLFGVLPTLQVDWATTPLPALHQAKSIVQELDFGSVDLNFTEGWEFKDILWEVYLPYAGLQSIQLKGNYPVVAKAVVDLITGAIEYYIFQNGQLISTANGYCTTELPFNINTAQASVAKQGWRNNLMSTVANMAAGIAGATNPEAGLALGAVNSVMAPLHEVAKTDIQYPSLGNTLGLCQPKTVRLIAKVPVIHNNAYGYPEIMGMNVSKAYSRLGDCRGFIKTENFKCEVIVATTDEKLEIERLLNAGVFI